MFKVSSNKERKLKKLKKNINEVLLLSGDDPTAVDLTSATFLGHSFDGQWFCQFFLQISPLSLDQQYQLSC